MDGVGQSVPLLLLHVFKAFRDCVCACLSAFNLNGSLWPLAPQDHTPNKLSNISPIQEPCTL